MAKPNYAFAKRQRDLAKKQKKEERKQRKAEAQNRPQEDTDLAVDQANPGEAPASDPSVD